MAPRQPGGSHTRLEHGTLVIDNGAYSIKAGLVQSDQQDVACTQIPNTIAHSSRDRRTYVGSQLSQCEDFGEMSFKRPMQKGYIVRWEEQRRIWEHEFFGPDAGMKVNPRESNLVLAEAPNAMPALQTMTDQMVFEYFEFASFYRCNGAALLAYNNISSLQSGSNNQHLFGSSHMPECLLVIDTGYSHTTITPLWNRRPLQSAIRRVSIGGKHITNHLKEAASIRHFNVMDETALLNEAKEAVCFVSDNFSRDLHRVWKGGLKDKKKEDQELVVDYVLPDYDTIKHGIVRPHGSFYRPNLETSINIGRNESILPLGNERFRAPELLFQPNDCGFTEIGIPQAAWDSVASLPEALRPAFMANVVVVGGNSLMPGFLDRLNDELRKVTPSDVPLRVTRPVDPVTYTWLGGARLAASQSNLSKLVITRAEYHEYGSGRLPLRFEYD